ncbi:MAG: methyltransferase [Proteobacteria bacterium]|nr:methyltransferase [Pseudomonadota bacterium]
MQAARSTRQPSVAQPDSPASGWLTGWHERWCAWRDRKLTSPEFQRRAARTWYLRPLARRRARALFDLVAGFVYSQVLLACVRVRAFEILAEGPQTAAVLASRFDLPLPATERLLAAAVSLDLVEHRRGGRYGLGKLGAPLVGNEAIASMVEHHAVLYADLQDPLTLLRGQGDAPALSRYWAYAEAAAPGALPRSEVDAYSALMSASQPLVAQEVLDAYPLHGHRCLLDVGGGQGRFLVAAGQRAPGLKLMLFDLPAVVASATAAFAAFGLGERAEVHGGDFTRDALPGGADIASLVRVLYDHGDERALTILRAVHRALPPSGTLLVAEPMAGAPGAPRMGDAYFGMYLLAMRGGRARTAGELSALLRTAGFEQVRELATPIPLQVGVLVCRRGVADSTNTMA